MENIEYVLPGEIEKRSFAIIGGRTKGAWYRASTGTGAGDKARDPYKCGF